MNYMPILTDPTEFSGTESELCPLCQMDLTFNEIQEEQKYCDNCFFSCCGDELNQDVRICPTCKEHN